jgi:hypothetical protein
MARMSREFSLVLMGAGVLTAGYFLVDDEDVLAKEEKQVSQEVNKSRSSGRYGHTFIFFHGGGWSSNGGGRYSATGGAGVTRGGFGGIGAHTSGGA